MFNKKQILTIQECGQNGYSLKVAGSELNMTYADFLDMYEDDVDAQKAYEKGQALLEVETVTLARLKMKEGDQKSFEFISGSVLKMGGKPTGKSDTPGAGKTKKVDVPSVLFNPGKLLEVSDEELQQRIADREKTKIDDVEEE